MLQARLLHCSSQVLRVASGPNRLMPAPTSAIPDVNTFLKVIGRKCDEFAENYNNEWKNLFEWDSAALKEKGIPPQQRKYILRQVERLRAGEPVIEFKKGKKSFFGGERKYKEQKAKWLATERKNNSS
ncbi:HBR323Wp [Eremothecium sinecaudum]|uniref:Small ribosomal subunit protein mS41 n=1 Tax=Eremothecium sinecaudum TaxID=45286 RepID=A0A109UXB6_9SACH|nr:HBR323Wp [Eremothecium sinecaudum]AMD19224.1 HBR323Wp [Eremothecium sinecaudum]